MKLSSLLNPRLIRCGLEARTKERALEEMTEFMAGQVPGITAGDLQAALLEREKLGPFSLTKGSAFPHARTEKVSDFHVAIGTVTEGIDFKAPDGRPIRVIVLFAIPKKHSSLYLQALALFLNLFATEDNLQRVLQAKSGEEVLAAIDQAPLRPAGAALPSVTRATTLARALEILSAARMEALPVVDAEGHLVGEITAVGVLQMAARDQALHLPRTGTPLEAALKVHADSTLEGLGLVAANGFQTAPEDEPAAETAARLARSGARGAYVLRGRRLVGILTAGEILRRVAGAK